MKPLVSVLLITYNHAPYIGRCIEGVLMQKTTFPFEIVIGEDCSPDGTREIVMEYAQKYPETIRIITSESNVGMIENSKRTYLACQGEFIATCEGDDYWIDPLKLQKQFYTINDYDAVFVTHKSIIMHHANGRIINCEIGPNQVESGFIKIEDIILRAKAFHISSFFISKKILNELPNWFFDAPTSDYLIQLISASKGKIYFINEIMSVYSQRLEGSWTDLLIKSENAKDPRRGEFEMRSLEMLKNFDDYTNRKYSFFIRRRISDRLVNYLIKIGNLDFLNIDKFKKMEIRFFAFASILFPNSVRGAIMLKFINHIWEAVQPKG